MRRLIICGIVANLLLLTGCLIVWSVTVEPMLGYAYVYLLAWVLTTVIIFRSPFG